MQGHFLAGCSRFFGAVPDKTEARLHLSKYQTAFQSKRGRIKMIILCCSVASVANQDQSQAVPPTL